MSPRLKSCDQCSIKTK